jgi:hypothetical protein
LKNPRCSICGKEPKIRKTKDLALQGNLPKDTHVHEEYIHHFDQVIVDDEYILREHVYLLVNFLEELNL